MYTILTNGAVFNERGRPDFNEILPNITRELLKIGTFINPELPTPFSFKMEFELQEGGVVRVWLFKNEKNLRIIKDIKVSIIGVTKSSLEQLIKMLFYFLNLKSSAVENIRQYNGFLPSFLDPLTVNKIKNFAQVD